MQQGCARTSPQIRIRRFNYAQPDTAGAMMLSQVLQHSIWQEQLLWSSSLNTMSYTAHMLPA
jgi:hypothetical protein